MSLRCGFKTEVYEVVFDFVSFDVYFGQMWIKVDIELVFPALAPEHVFSTGVMQYHDVTLDDFVSYLEHYIGRVMAETSVVSHPVFEPLEFGFQFLPQGGWHEENTGGIYLQFMINVDNKIPSDSRVRGKFIGGTASMDIGEAQRFLSDIKSIIAAFRDEYARLSNGETGTKKEE